MRLTLIATLIMVMSIADVCPAIDPDLNARLGIPVQPQDSGETYGPGLLNPSVSMGLGGCGDIGIDNSLGNLLSLAQAAADNAKNLPQIAGMAAMAYFLPTEYSVTANLLSQAQKYLAILADKCKTYQAARQFLESQDVAGIRKASFAKCMEQHNADEVFCSKPSNSWYSLFGTQECVSAVDKSLADVKLPDGDSKESIKAFFGDVKMCRDGSGAIRPVMTAAKVYQANMLFYGPAVDQAVSIAQKRYLTQDDIQKMNLCVGTGNNSNDGNGGVICPNATTINMLATFPDDEQAIFKRKLAEHLSLLATVYNTYRLSALMNRAAAQVKTLSPDAYIAPVGRITGQKQKEVNDLVKLKIQANGNNGDLSNWESRVMERNSYWQQRQQNAARAKAQYESAYGNQGEDAPNRSMQQEINQDMKNSYNR